MRPNEFVKVLPKDAAFIGAHGVHTGGGREHALVAGWPHKFYG
jgi:hypothetical protein